MTLLPWNSDIKKMAIMLSKMDNSQKVIFTPFGSFSFSGTFLSNIKEVSVVFCL